MYGLVGNYVIKTGNPVYSPPIPRGGLAAVFGVNVIQVLGSPGLSVSIEHKSETDTAFANLGTFAAISSTGVSTKELSGIKEVVRFAFAFTGGTDGDLMLVELLRIIWKL